MSTAHITTSHRERMAYVYVRQSTLWQVNEHQESTERQYRLQKRALELGWPPTAIAVIDEDQGRSGSSATARTGFQRLAIESVQLDGVSRPGWIEVQIRWRSGVVTRLEVKRAQPEEGSLKTPAQAVAGIHELAAHLSYDKIAEELNAAGWRTAFGRPFAPAASTSATFAGGMAAGAKGLARREMLIKPGNGGSTE